ncbi:MAG: hypothetical protein KAI91_04985 [Candidatus Omnitrophica bacterium]|nr:hypothetical protein [Candidatus Omnitrophota bacterium]MCK5393673.1 hypothetical protein [Candidatus Omnitrophota bacterium]
MELRLKCPLKKGFKKNRKFIALMSWVNNKNEWFMYSAANRKFIMNFNDKVNVENYFPGINKKNINSYELLICKKVDRF